MKVADLWLKVKGQRLQLKDCRLSFEGCIFKDLWGRLQIEGWRLKVAGCRLQVASFMSKLQIILKPIAAAKDSCYLEILK